MIINQSDKLVFSHILSLAEYGYFSLLIVISSAVAQFSAPITQAILPRLTYYIAHGQNKKMIDLYCQATNWVCIVIFSVAGCVAMFSKVLLYAWSGNMAIANFGSSILIWYVLASGILSVAALQYFFQVAYGSLKLHAFYNTVALCIKTPLIIFIAFRYGVYATAVTWFFLMLISFFIWVPIVHCYYTDGMHFRWLKNVMIILINAVLGFISLNFFSFNFYSNRIEDLFKLFSIGLLFLTYMYFCVKIQRKLKWIN